MLLAGFISSQSYGQISVTVTGNTNATPALAGSYSSLADAITDLNLVTSLSGPVVFELAAGTSENTAAQYNITLAGDLANAITFQKSGVGANPVLNRTDAGSNTTSTVGGLGDAVIRIDGTDNLHFDGLDVTASNQGIENGYFTSKTATNACQTFSIKNCAITMTKGTSAYVMGIHIGNGSTSVSAATGVTVSANSGRTENVTITGVTISNVHIGIYCRGYNSATLCDQNLVIGASGAGNGNTIQNFGGGSGTTTYGIYIIYANNANANYNTINNAGGGGSAHASTLYGIFYTTGVIGTISGSNNNITMNTSGTSAVQWIFNGNTGTSINFNNNTFGGTIGATSTSYLIYNNNSSASVSVSGNATSGTITKTGASGTFYGYYNNGSPTSGTETISGNNFSNISVTGSSVFTGINSTTGVGQNCDIFNNTISSVTAGTGTITGINVSYHAIRNIYGNSISDLSGNGPILGIGNSTSANATVNNVYKNKICNLSSTSPSTTIGLVTGILFASNSGATVNAYNNLIGNLTVSAAVAGTDAVRGISITSTTASQNINISYNTIYLNTAGTGNFGSSGVFHTASATATTANLTLRNNIIYNSSTPSGLGVTAAYRRSSTNNANYNAASDRNLFWGGTPSSTQLIFTNGTNSYDDISAYKAYIVTQDQNSVTEDVTWESTSCSSPDFLKNDDAVVSAIEGGAANISGITDDYAGTIRQGNPGYLGTGSAPDLGAWELEGALPTCGTPALANAQTTNANPCNGQNFTLTLDIAYGLGYSYQWQESTAGAGGPYTNIGGATNDVLITNSSVTKWYRCEVTCITSTISTTSTEVQVTVATPLNGTYVIDNTGSGDYLTFTAAIADLSCLGVSGPVTFEVVDGQVFPEATSLECTFNGTSTNTITFKKQGAGVNPKIQLIGTSGTSDYILKLTGVDYYTFDGIDFEQTGTSTTDWVEYGVWITNASATNGSQNNNIKNGVVTLSNGNASARGVFMNQAVTATNATGTNSNNKFLNMTVTSSYVGYYITGNSTTLDDGNEIDVELSGTSIISNLGDGTVTGSLYGVFATYQTNLKVKNTEFTNFNQGGTSLMYGVTCQSSALNSAEISNNHMHGFTGAGTQYGIYFSSMGTATVSNNQIHNFVCNTATSSSVRGVYVTATGADVDIYNNKIYDLQSNGLTTTTVVGIDVATGLVFDIYNNMVSDLRAPASTTTTGGTRGISVSGGSTGGVVRIYYNSVYLNDVGTVAGYTSAGIHNSSVTPTLDLRNNVVVNKSNITTGTRVAAFWKTSSTDNVDNNSNNNLYYAGTPDAAHLIYYDGTNSAQTISAYNVLSAITPGESASQTEDVAWATITNGVLRPDAATASYIESGGQNIVGFTSDFEGDSRTGYPLGGQVNGGGFSPDMGADEGDFTFLVPPAPDCATYDAPADAATDVCSYGTVTLDWTAAITGGIVTLGYDVYFGTNPTPPFVTNVSSTNYSPSGLLPNTTYYWKIVPKNVTGDAVGCLTYSFTTINAEVTSANGDTRCGPGTVNLTASGSGTFNWYTAASGGAPVGTGSPFSPNVTSTTNYWVSASDGGINGNVGASSPAIGTTSSSTIAVTTQYTTFDVLAPMTINTVTVYPTASIGSTFNISIRNSSGTEIFNTGSILTTVTGGNTPQVVTVNAPMLPGTAYRIGLGVNPGMTRNTTGATYPYTLPGVISITGNSFDVNYIYFLYNWSVSSGCESPRTMVTATVIDNPVADDPADVSACDSYTLPALTVGNYFSGTGGTGTAYIAGNVISSSMTMYVYAETGTTPNCTDENSFTITINTSPTATISGDASICSGNSTNLTLNFTGTAPWTYAINGGAPATTSNNPETVAVSPVSTTVYTITSLSDANCTGSGSGSATVTVFSAAPDFLISYQPTPASACAGNTVTLTVNPVNNAESYSWSAPAGTLINGQVSPVVTTSNSVTVTFGAVAANGSGWSICVFASNPCGVSQTKCAFIRGALSAPAAITGSKTACESSSQTYSTNAVGGANSYIWTGTNGITFTGSGTTITANFPAGFTTGTICVAGQLSCGYTGPQRCLTVTNTVATLGTMSGAFAVCPGQTGLVFSIPSVAGAASYTWTTPAGVTVTSGAGTNSVTVSVNNSFTVGNICVTATSICGIVSPQRCKTISSIKPNTPGNIVGNSTGVCNATVTYSVTAVAGVTSYNWTAPAGATFATPNGTNTIDVTFPSNFTTGQLCVVAVNGCGSSASRCINIKGAPGTAGTISDPGVVCANDQGIQFTITPVFGATNYNWTVPAGANIVAGQGTTTLTVDWGTNSGTVGVTASNSCGNSGTRTRSVVITCRNSSSILPSAEVVAYPNPVSSELTVEMNTLSAGNYSLTMTDLTGRVMLQQAFAANEGKNESKLDVSNYAKGVYLLTVKSETGFTKQIRVTVQ